MPQAVFPPDAGVGGPGPSGYQRCPGPWPVDETQGSDRYQQVVILFAPLDHATFSQMGKLTKPLSSKEFAQSHFPLFHRPPLTMCVYVLTHCHLNGRFAEIPFKRIRSMAQTQEKRARLSIDVPLKVRRHLRVAAAQRDMTIRQYVLDAVQERLREDVHQKKEEEEVLALTAQADPVLAELWDNERDAAYDQL